MSIPKTLNHFNVKVFAKNAQTLSGEATLADFPRVEAETFNDESLRAQTHIQWQLTGEQRPGAQGMQTWLTSEVSANLFLPCHRCLQPVPVEVASEQQFRFVATAEQADEEDGEALEDVLTFEEAENAHALLEDDLLMALPMGVMHEQCPVSLPTSAQDAAFVQAQTTEKKNPFAALAALKVTKNND